MLQQGHRVCNRDAYVLLDELADATLERGRKEVMTAFAIVPLLNIDDLDMRKLPSTAAEDLLELVMRGYERASTLLTSNLAVEDWGKLLGDTAAVTALLDRLHHHAHILQGRPSQLALPQPAQDELARRAAALRPVKSPGRSRADHCGRRVTVTGVPGGGECRRSAPGPRSTSQPPQSTV
jgi:hypothetical protein